MFTSGLQGCGLNGRSLGEKNGLNPEVILYYYLRFLILSILYYALATFSTYEELYVESGVSAFGIDSESKLGKLSSVI